MLHGVSLTAVKGATFCFKRVWVVSGCLREFQPRLVFDDVEDLVDREVQGVKVTEPSAFAVIGGTFFLGAGARRPLAHFLELSG